MKKIYLLLSMLIVCTCLSQAQITITQNDMPHPGDTTRLTAAQLNLFLNFTATGANHTWDFTNLRTNNQRLDSAMSVSATNLIYALYYSNLPFNPNRATLAFKGAGQAVNPLIPLTNPFSFFYLNSSSYKQVGIGTEILNIPAPVAFNNDDVIYQLPLHFGDTHISNSDWGFGLNGIGYLGYSQTRINEVDGWGTLLTPNGTYDVLRVKTTRAQRDSVSLDSLNLNLGLDRPLLTEYKWLANGKTSPVLQINTQTIFGIEVITEILFIDDFLKIETNPLASNAICAGSTVSVPYTKYGSFNGQTFFNPGNQFKAELSDLNGSFANPLTIGTITSKLSGSIQVVIPATILPGNHYRIRVISTSPARTGSDNGTDLSIEFPVTANALANGPLTFCQPGQVDLVADSSEGYHFQWMLNSAPLTNATMANYSALQSGSYTVEVSNSCGAASSNTFNILANPAPTVTITGNLNFLLCPGNTQQLSALVTDATSMQWQLNGIDIPGEITDSTLVSQAGIYTLIATNTCGTVTSAAISITAGTTPSVSIAALGNSTFCAGGSVLLEATTTDVLSYQWQLNGVDIPAATDSVFLASASGIYSLVVTNDCATINSTGITVVSNPIPTQPLITVASDTLISTSAASYQWYLNGTAIPGATASSYVTSQNGLYSVLITDVNGCTSLSNDYNVLNTGISSSEADEAITYYPNPVNQELIIRMPSNLVIQSIIITNVIGETVIKINNPNSNDLLILNTAALRAGYYSLQVMNKGQISHYPIIKN